PALGAKINGFSFDLNQVNPGAPGTKVSVFVRVYDYAAGSHTLDIITDIQVDGVSLNLALLTQQNGGYVIPDLVEDQRITIFTADGYDRVEIGNVSPDNGGADETFDIGGVQFGYVTGNPEVKLGFDVALTDGDGDSVKGEINIKL